MATKSKSLQGLKSLSITERVKTINWKFSEVAVSYPNLTSLKDTRMTNPFLFYNSFKSLFENEVREKFVVFWLNQANKVFGYEVVSEGTLTSSVVHAREVFRGAVVSSCASIIVAHNHPGGSLQPSEDDISITKKLVAAGEIVGIKILDHFIFIDNTYYSFAENRLM